MSCLENVYSGVTHNKSQLDYILTKAPDQYENNSTISSSVTTDHAGILAKPADQIPKRRYAFFRDHNYQNVLSFNAALDGTDFSFITRYSDPNEGIQLLIDTLDRLYQEYFPLKKVKVSQKDPFYITPQIKALLKKKANARRRNQRSTGHLGESHLGEKFGRDTWANIFLPKCPFQIRPSVPVNILLVVSTGLLKI